jgi:hypothetical protein
MEPHHKLCDFEFRFCRAREQKLNNLEVAQRLAVFIRFDDSECTVFFLHGYRVANKSRAFPKPMGERNQAS